MSRLAAWMNAAWMARCAAEGRAFRRAAKNVVAAQAGVLREILHANRQTEFGQAHGFDQIQNPASYQQRVPLATYEDFAEPIRRIAAGESNILTHEPVELLEPTSGTTGGEKLVPYTASLRRGFQRGIAAWIADLFWQRPAVRAGRAYWSISPALGPARRSEGGIPIGFDDDAAYLGRLEQWALGRLLVVPAAVARLPDIQAVRYATLLLLLAADDLSLISVWSPTFLTALLSPLAQWREQLLLDLRRGTFTPPAALPEASIVALRPWFRARPKRADQLRGVLGSSDDFSACTREIWPRLALISCWTDAGAARFVPELQGLFPRVEIQPKGLLATEGFVSLPLVEQEAAALAVRSHFFEFEAANALDGRCHLAHELDRGGRYRLLLTTGGGLYRYRLGDEVEVGGHFHECPLLRFLGKADRVSDLVGEKLSEAHVQTILSRLFAARAFAPRFAMLVPVLDRPPRYRLYLQGKENAAETLIAAELQAGLEENPYYRHAVRFGQLASAEVCWLDPAGESGWAIYETQCLSRGQRCGDIKPAALDSWTGWPELFSRARSAAGLAAIRGPVR